VANTKAGHITQGINQTDREGMRCSFIGLVMTRMRKFSGTADKSFFIVIVKAIQPGPAVNDLLADDIVEMIVDPAFPAGLFPFPAGVDVGQGDTKECRIRQSGDPCFTGSLFHLPLQDEELTIISQLGIEQQ
jgi:hypothetical protein